MCENEENLPDTLTAATPLISEGATLLPPLWGRLVHRRCFLTTVELRNDVYTLGRSPSCTITLNLTNTTNAILRLTSKEHFSVSKDKTNVPYIKDLSKNGTYLNGRIIGRGKMATLRDGDIIAIGAKPHEIYQFKDEAMNFICDEFDAKYAVTRQIGHGAFGEVYLAISKRGSQRYAVKKIPITGRAESKITNEVEIMTAVSHPCVVRMIEAIRAPAHVYIVLEYMEGGELQSRVLEKRRLRESTAKLYVYQAAIAVQHLHSCGITHRDLKPENVLLKTRENNTNLKITDFGLSKIVGHSTAMKSLCGTPLYVAPEVLKVTARASSYTPQVDVWSLGCILYFTLFGQTPFVPSEDPEEDTLQHLYAQIIKGEYDIPVKTVRTRDHRLVDQYFVSDSAVELIRLMLETDPVKRVTVDGVLSHEWFEDSRLKMKIAQLFD